MPGFFDEGAQVRIEEQLESMSVDMHDRVSEVTAEITKNTMYNLRSEVPRTLFGLHQIVKAVTQLTIGDLLDQGFIQLTEKGMVDLSADTTDGDSSESVERPQLFAVDGGEGAS